MCGRYIVVQTVEQIEKRFNVKVREPEKLKNNYNLGVGQYAPVITNDKSTEVQFFQFGLTPIWAKKPMYLFNARSEGKSNESNDPSFTGGKDIINMPSFRKPIRSQRCLVIASAFIEGSKDEGLDKPYVIYLKDNKRPFALAGIWDTWKNQETLQELNSFSIITTTANALLQTIGHHRMPVIIDESEERTWLNNDTPLSHITSMMYMYNHELMNAYPVSPAIKSPKNNYKELLDPVGQRIYPEYETVVTSHMELQGFGSGKRRTIE